MPARKPSGAKNAAPLHFDIQLTRSPGAPSKPGATTLETLFARALALVPASRKPMSQKNRGLAVDIHVVTDAQIAGLNLAHLKVHGATDVLSFIMSEFDPERGAFHLGEIVVSFETAQREAFARQISVTEELSRYCVHGLLHLLGYEDDTPAQRKRMFAVQEKVLSGK